MRVAIAGSGDLASYLSEELLSLIIPGTGEEPLDFAAARDVTKAIVALCTTTLSWEPTIYVRGERTTWNALKTLLNQTSWGKNLAVSYVSKEELDDVVRKRPSEDEVLAAEYALFSLSGAGLLPDEKLERQREKYFAGIKFRTNKELVEEAKVDGRVV